MRNENSIIKVLTIKENGHCYYVQEMPKTYNLGRDFAVMKDRKRLTPLRFDRYEEAKAWLLKRLLVDMGQRSIDTHIFQI